MAERQNRQDQDKVIIRLPDGMRDEIKAEAKKHKRSANAEIVARLSGSGIGGGKTLRDEFAMAALTGLATHPDLKLSDAAGIAYRAADLMLAARQKDGA